MRKIILFTFCLAIVTPIFAINLKDFHNKNFEAIGNYCSLHLEVSKNHLFVTYIIPLSDDETNACGENGRARGCNGYTQKLICNNNGICDDPNGSLSIELLEDGNLYSSPKGIKNLRSDKTQYYWCE